MNIRHLVGVVAVTGALVTAPAAHADTQVPLGTCVDFLFYDGVDSRPAAAACASALTAAGYAVHSGSNVDARTAVADLPNEAVYYHGGHSLDVGGTAEGTHIAIASLYETNDPTVPYTGTLGDSFAGADYNGGTVTLCKSGGSPCKSANTLLYAHADLLAKANLALFEDCATAYWHLEGYINMAEIAYDANAGTAIGFKGDTAALSGNPWGVRFWNDLQNGMSYSSALVDATNLVSSSVYRYDTYVQYHHAGAPTTLRPAGFYVP